MLAQLFKTPVFQNACVQEILVDGYQQQAEIFIQLANYHTVALHDFSSLINLMWCV